MIKLFRKACVRLQQRTIAVGMLVGLALTFMPTLVSAVQAQSLNPNLPKLELPRLTVSPASSSTEIDRGEVRLDGRRLFAIAAPAVRNRSRQSAMTPIESRIQDIEANLRRLVERNFASDQLQVTSEIDAQSNLPVISVNSQYVMTVTTLDAQLQGLEPAAYADDITPVIREALIQAQQERQPSSLVRQGLFAAGTLVAMLIFSWGLTRWQHLLKAQQNDTQAEIPADPIVSPNTAATADFATRQTVQQQLEKRQQRNLKDAQRRSLQLLQAAVWAYGVFTILGLFPYTRSLQPIVLSAPLKIASVGIVAYLMIRLSDVLIDRFFSALEAGEFVTPEASQRLALRISTFSRVVKSLSTLLILSISVLTILSIAGIEVVPLLAGAGIIGLGISLASQNLIKDVINGFLILLEDQYGVGDVIQIGKAAGLVEYMNLRITQLRNAEGRLITIPNSAITVVENLSKDWSRVDLAIVVSYDTEVDSAIQLIEKVGQDMSHDQEWSDKILESPEVLGVDDLNNTGVTLRVWIKTQALQQWRVGREFRRRLKLAMDEQGIAIGVPQQTFSLRGSFEERAFDGNNGSNSSSGR